MAHSESLLSFSKLIAQYPVLDNSEIIELVTNKHTNYKNIIIKSNLRLVWKIANDFKGSIPMEELISGGNEGLIKAVNKYDPIKYKNVKFSTYASHWIKWGMRNRIHFYKDIIRIPPNVSRKVFNAIRELENNNIPLTIDNIRKLSKTSQKTTYSVLECNSKYMINLDEYNTEGINNSEIIPHEKSDNTPEDSTIEMLYSLLDELPKRDSDIIKYKYGLFGKPPMTLEQISKIYGLSRERIRQIIYKTLNQLNNRFKVNNINNELEW